MVREVKGTGLEVESSQWTNEGKSEKTRPKGGLQRPSPEPSALRAYRFAAFADDPASC